MLCINLTDVVVGIVYRSEFQDKEVYWYGPHIVSYPSIKYLTDIPDFTELPEGAIMVVNQPDIINHGYQAYIMERYLRYAKVKLLVITSDCLGLDHQLTITSMFDTYCINTEETHTRLRQIYYSKYDTSIHEEEFQSKVKTYSNYVRYN